MTKDELLRQLDIAKDKIDPMLRLNIVASVLSAYFNEDKEIFFAIITGIRGTESARKAYERLYKTEECKWLT